MSTFLELVQAFWIDNSLEGAPPSSVANQTGMKQKVCRWVQRADVEVQNEWQNWKFMFTPFQVDTIASIALVTAPTDLGTWDMDSFFLDDEKLSPVGYTEWRDNFRLSTDTGQPWGFTLDFGNNIILIPTPDGIYTLEADYYKAPQKMDANASTSPVPSRFDMSIIHKAAEYYADSEDNVSLLQSSQRNYYTIKTKMEAVYLPGMEPYTTSDNDSYLEFD